MRYLTFMKNLRKSKQMQETEHGTAVYGVNKYSDFTEAELRRLTGLAVPKEHHNVTKSTFWPASSPFSFDWREHNAVTEIKDQKSCNNSWAFSTVANIEELYALKYGNLVALSEQELTDCDNNGGHCNGGDWPFDAYLAVMGLGGLESVADYPNVDTDEKCKLDKSKEVATVTGRQSFSRNETRIAANLEQNGPLSVVVNSQPFGTYVSGIIDNTLCTGSLNLDLAVTLVGYGTENTGTREGGGSGSFRRYPVMVFIHGESYEWNSGNPYDGSVLASYGAVVVVTVNYRLGILGFLNANTDTYIRSPANYGLMDQIAALHWIQENIAVFGGDPTNVTIFGHGTGAACVNFLMTSSAVPDGLLFHRAILMSGAGLSPWALVQEPARYAALVAQHANCSPDLPHPHLMKCLRDRPLEVLLSTPIRAPEFAFAFGPSVDGVVIDTGDIPPPSESQNFDSGSNPGSGSKKKELPQNAITTLNNVLLKKTAVSKLTRYDLLLGVVKAEAYFAFNGEDVQYGIEADRRSKILRTFVRNTYSYHLSEILATIVNEYTDWERPVQHPINIRDETLEALSDAQVVAPIIHTADLHSAERRNSYLYVFDYQTKFGDFPQRQGCIHGEELPYILGAPLVGGMMHFARNYTKTEMLLAEATMIYWSNFARTGNPNEPQETEPVHGVRQERNRFKNIEWTAYEAVHKKYLNIDTKPRLKNHYRAHRLSFWLNLVPDLHRPGGDDVPNSHHALEDDDAPPTQKVPPLNPRKLPTTEASAAAITKVTPSSLNLSQVVTLPTIDVTDRYGDDSGLSTTSHSNVEDGFAAYSTALSVVIAIGCSLLILNVLVFAGVYYQRDKSRLNHEHNNGQPKKRNENGQMPNNICGDLESSIVGLKTDPTTILAHHHSHTHHQLPPPEFADLPQNNATLPRPPPPPKATKANVNTLTSNQLQHQQPENQPLLSTHTIQLINTGTLTKKNTQLNAKQNTTMEELRV